MNIMRKLAMVAVLTAAATTTSMAVPLQWGTGGLSLNWSDTNNWNYSPTYFPWVSPPGLSDVVNFEDALYQLGFTRGWTNVPGAVNNIVDTNFSIGAVNYTARTPSYTDLTPPTNHYYTTLIPAGVSLTLGGSGSGMTAALAVGDVPGAGTWANPNVLNPIANYSTIIGAGALNVTNSTMLISVGMANSATLDLVGLNQFNASVSQVLVGASPDNPYILMPTGWLLLARTNVITTAPNLSGPGIFLGFCTNSTSGGAGLIGLGATNAFNTDGLTVGGRRSATGSGSIPLSKVVFSDNYLNTTPLATFTLRGSAGGGTPIETFSIGDQSANCDGYGTAFPGTSSSANGTADFSGGYVDILADTIVVGRTADTQVPQGGGGFGFLIVEHGTVTATNVFVAQKMGTNASLAKGTLTLKGDVVMNVVSNFTLGYRTNLNNSFAAIGTLNVNDSAVLNVGGNLITGYTNNGTQLQTINIGTGQINVAGLITNLPGSQPPNLNIAGGMLSGANGTTMFLTSLNGSGTITNISTTTVSSSLTLGSVIPDPEYSNDNLAFAPGTLDVEGNLAIGSNVSLTFKLGSNLTPGGPFNDYLKVANDLSSSAISNPINLQFLGQPNTNGSYDLIYYGGNLTGGFANGYANNTRNYTFTLDQSTPHHVKLNVSGGPPATLTWTGGANGVWDANAYNWTNNSNSNPDKFYAYDQVVFDDTGSWQFIQFTNTVLEGGITFNNNSKTYTLYGADFIAPSARISGYGGITKNGTGTVILDMTSALNDFVGPININNGVIQDQSYSTGYGGNTGHLFGSTNNVITIASGASLDVYGLAIGARTGANGVWGYVGYPIVFSGSGFGGMGAIVNNNGVVADPGNGAPSTLYTPSATLSGDTSIGVTHSGLNLTVRGTSPGAQLNLAGHTLSTIGAGDTILSTFIATNAGDIQVNGNSLSLVDVQLGGSGTLIVGSKTLGLGTLSGSGWSSTYGISKAISIGGAIVAVGSSAATAGVGGVTIPVSSPITLTGNTTINNIQTINFSGVISGGFGITKQGTGNLSINNVDTYSGSTIVNAGALVLGSAGSLVNSPLVQIGTAANLDVTAQSASYTIPSGQTVQVDGSAYGSFTVPSGSTISGSGSYALLTTASVAVNGGSVVPGQLNVSGTVTFGTLNLNNATVILDLNPATTAGAGVNDLVAAKTLSLTGVNTIKIVPHGILNTGGGRYTLFTYSGAALPSSVTNNMVLTDDSAYSFAFVDPATTPGSIQITASGGNRNFDAWHGGAAAAPTAWDIQHTTNWLVGGTNVIFNNDDSVLFDDAGTNVVNLTASVRPLAVTFSNNVSPYTLQGPGSLSADAVTNSGSAGVTISNSANNTLTGGGLYLNSGTVTFNQPVNATFNSMLNGTAALAKAGTNQLTLIGNSGATYNGPVAVNNGILIPGNPNAFGAGTVTVASGATVDLNGQVLISNIFVLSGSGMGGLGAINNTGSQQKNAVQNVILNGDTTLGAVSRWDLTPGGPSSFQGNSHNLNKVGAGSIFLGPGQDTGVNNIDIKGGELAFAWQGTDLGSTGLITVESNAVLAFAYDISAGSKPTEVKAGGQIGAEYMNSYGGNNAYAGDITFDGKGIVNITSGSAGLNLSGSLHGSSGLVNAGRGTLTLSGNNNYSGDLTFNLGNGCINNNNALPPGTSVTLNSLGTPNVDNVGLTLSNGIATSASVPLNMVAYFGPAGGSLGSYLIPSLGGNGIWNGPINITPVQLQPSTGYGAGIAFYPTVNINGGSPKLLINGNITRTAPGEMSLVFGGDLPGTVSLTQPLIWTGKVTLTGNNTTTNNPATSINTLELNAANNSFTNFSLVRGKLRIGADNAYPSACPLSGPSTSSGDSREIIDLNGHTQTFSNINLTLPPVWIGNDSTSSDATVVYDSSGQLTNTWTDFWIVDNLNPNLFTPHKTGLTVRSGALRLAPNVITYANPSLASGPTNNNYSGPTFVTGGTFQCDTACTNTAVTVSGTGSLRGTGPFGKPIQINNGGTLSPGGDNNVGLQIGNLTNNSTLTCAAGSTNLMKYNLFLSSFDSVRGLSSVIYGGTLVVSNLGSTKFNTSKSAKFYYAASYSGGFANIIPAVPAPGLVWNTNTLTTDGTLRVATVSTTPPVLQTTISGGNLTLSWPLDHAGWRLLVQTNTLNVGLNTNSWVTVPNSTNFYSFTTQIVSTNPTVFYRLVYP
jgi:autotransporter-associated beta strand protein